MQQTQLDSPQETSNADQLTRLDDFTAADDTCDQGAGVRYIRDGLRSLADGFDALLRLQDTRPATQIDRDHELERTRRAARCADMVHRVLGTEGIDLLAAGMSAEGTSIEDIDEFLGAALGQIPVAERVRHALGVRARELGAATAELGAAASKLAPHSYLIADPKATLPLLEELHRSADKGDCRATIRAAIALTTTWSSTYGTHMAWKVLNDLERQVDVIRIQQGLQHRFQQP